MKDQPINPMQVDVTGAEVVAHVSTDRGHSRNWTELWVYFIPSPSGRCFLADVKGCTRVGGQVQRRRAVYVGSLDRALQHFDDSDLAGTIELQARDWEDRNADRVRQMVEQLRAEEKSGRVGGLGYTGSTMLGAIAWLYGDAQAGKAQRVEDDFGVPRRTVAHALDQEQSGQALTGWAKAFISALQHFDRASFLAAKGTA